MNPTNPIPAEALIEHQAFLRALARGLLADPEAAEDVVQETWLAALTRAPAAPDSLRAWLARVARNAALNLRRGERRRAARERASAREEAAPLESEVAERLAEQARVAEAVRALREPYRTTIFLRYAEGLPPREVARRLGVPVETVRSQQKRGLAELRRRLERDLGGQRAPRRGCACADRPGRSRRHGHDRAAGGHRRLGCGRRDRDRVGPRGRGRLARGP